MTSGDIEFIDAVVPGQPDEAETVTTPASGRGGLAALALVAVIGLGIASLASGSDDFSPETTEAPPTTTEPQPDEAALEDISTGEEAPTFTLGAGPPLVWRAVPTDTAANNWRWVEDRFIGIDDERSLELVPGTDNSRLASFFPPIGGIDINSTSSVFGDGTSSPSQLTFSSPPSLEPSGPSIMIDPLAPPANELVDFQTEIAAERRDDDVLVLQTVTAVLNIEAFRSRTGITLDPIFGIEIDDAEISLFGTGESESIPVAEIGLTDADLAALRLINEPITVVSFGLLGGSAEVVDIDLARIDWIAVVDDEFVAGGNELRRSVDGINWQSTSEDTPRFGGLLVPSADDVLTGLSFEQSDSFITLSDDAGRTWRPVASPMSNTWQVSSSFPVLAATGWTNNSFLETPEDWSVFTPRFELRITNSDDSFELLDRNGTVLLSGLTGDPSSGFRFVPGSLDIWFVDPATGVEVARFDRTLFNSSLGAAQTIAGNPQLVAFADMSAAATSHEWSLTPVNELFGEQALSVEFVAGNGWLLADVTTSTGRDLFVAEVPDADPLARPLGERRHPTYADLAREQAEQE